jgi:hypothetical protein
VQLLPILLAAASAVTRPSPSPSVNAPLSACTAISRVRVEQVLGRSVSAPEREESATQSTCDSSLWYAYHNEDYGESRVMVRARRRPAFGAGSAAHEPVLDAT